MHILNPNTQTARGRLAGLTLGALLAAAVLSLSGLTPRAFAYAVISTSGEGAGQTSAPHGLAVDYETGKLYVADTQNNRVDVFDAAGVFEEAFGWGVRDGEEKSQTCTTATTCRKGLAGAGSGQFAEATQVAVDNSCFLHKPEPLTGAPCETFDPSNGDVYVVDLNTQRVEKFDAQGNFLLSLGGGVDQGPHHPGNVCSAASVAEGDICGAGSNGFAEGEFSSMTSIYIGVGPGGTIYVLDNHRTSEDVERKERLQRFESSGAELVPQQILAPEEELASALAVGPTGAFYVASESGAVSAVRKYEPDGTGTLVGIVAEEQASTLALDPADDLFFTSLTEAGKEIHKGFSFTELDPAGDVLRRFGYGVLESQAEDGFLGVGGIAPFHSTSGDMYVSEAIGSQDSGSRVLHLDFPDTGPVTRPEPCQPSSLGNTKATLQAEVNPEGKATTYHFQYITDADFLANGNSFDGEHHATSTPESPSIGSDFVMHQASAEIAVTPETTYRCRVTATNSDAPGGVTGPEGTFTSLPPLRIDATWTSSVLTDTATLDAEVDPLGIPTTGYFEYVEESVYQTAAKKAEEEGKDAQEAADAGFADASKVPDTPQLPIDFGSGEGGQVGSAAIGGLQAGTAYRYRVLATDPLIAPREVPGPSESFRTFRAGAAALPDDRVWEMVSPAQKNSAEVGVGEPDGGAVSEIQYHPIQASADSGEAITYTSWTSFGEAASAPGTSQYLSTRTPGGWTTQNISPPPPGPQILVPPYRGFSTDLKLSALVNGQLSPGGELIDNLVLRNDQTGASTTLTVGEPVDPQINPNAGIVTLCLDYAGSNMEGSRAFFAADASYAGAPAIANGGGFTLYEWSVEEGLKPISILPGKSSAAVPTPSTAFGAAGAHCQTAEKVMRHVVSADGRTAFWTYAPATGATQLLAHLAGEETIQLDAKAKEPGVLGPSGGGTLRAASTDGSKAVFTAPGNLTKDAGAPGQLYRYDTTSRSLADLTPGTIAPQIQGVVGASDDTSYVYFVAQAVLTGGQENAAGEKAAEGAENLYLYHDGDGIRFLATLASTGPDGHDWESNPHHLTARVSPDGQHLAFLSTEAQRLVGYDNRTSEGSHCELPTHEGEELTGAALCPEAFFYDVKANSLVCASCNPTGARPKGPANLPVWTNQFEGPRYLSDDGSRLFFESEDSLNAADQNDKRDVYEFELAGHGSCTSESPDFDPRSGGCQFLISGGDSSDESYLLDASSDGRDVFFSTRVSLARSDTNENHDVYDAREAGGFPEPGGEAPFCSGEECRSSASSPAPFGPLASSTLVGPGNLAPQVVVPTAGPKPTHLTRAQQLAKALKQCKRLASKKKRARCKARARRRYGMRRK
jgi:DNA-binding beta-propeller fold protein YncE